LVWREKKVLRIGIGKKSAKILGVNTGLGMTLSLETICITIVALHHVRLFAEKNSRRKKWSIWIGKVGAFISLAFFIYVPLLKL